jgi:DNA (cytosine-5)-methyltransferase 1
MRHGSLFSGIGGFDLAAEWMGWENVFHCEWNEFGQKVLKHHFPQADSYSDICKTDFRKYAGSVQIVSGGFPCQPFSQAGKRKGTDDERYLWGEMLRAVQEIKPIYVIAENVYGITNIDGGLVFEQVHLDLEAEGYEVQTFIIPACAKDAPHRRDRCWFVAYSTEQRLEGSTRSELQGRSSRSSRSDDEGNAPDSDSWRLERSAKSGWNCINAQRNSKLRNAPDSSIERLQRSEEQGSTPGVREEGEQFSSGFIQPSWEKFPTQSPICGGDDGIPRKLDSISFPKWRNESIKAYGNAIVPQVAHEIFKAIGEAENLLE